MQIKTSHSPTVVNAFKQKPDWFIQQNGFESVDSEGYGANGYHIETKKDRAGFTEGDYINSLEHFENYGYDSILYHDIQKQWYLNSNNEICQHLTRKAA